MNAPAGSAQVGGCVASPRALEDQLCFQLYAAANLLTRLYGPVLAELGLTYPQYLVLLLLGERAPQSVGELGARLYLDSGTLTPLLKRMELAGSVRRQRDPEDERRVLVQLTEAGRLLRQQACAALGALVEEHDLPVDEVDQLRAALPGMIARLAAWVG